MLLYKIQHPFGSRARRRQRQCRDNTLGIERVVRPPACCRTIDPLGCGFGIRCYCIRYSIPLAAGLGGGSGNAATTLLGLNELFGLPLVAERLTLLAAALGSDVTV